SLPHISVAGAVATATHGSGDARRNLAAAVVGLEVVAADGGLVHLGPQDDDLAGAVVSLGALGMVTAVALEIEPTFEVVQEVRTAVPWDAVLRAFDQVTASADSVSLFTRWEGEVVDQLWRKSRVGRPEGAWAPGPVLEAGTVAAENLHPLGLDARSTTEQLGRPGPWHERLPHFRMAFTPSNGAELQSEYLVPREHGPAAIEALRGLSHLISPLLLVSEVRTIAQDELWLSTAYQQDSVGLHFTWKPLQPEVEALLPRIERELAPFGARPHWGKLFSATEAGAPGRLAELYPRLGQFRELAARFDPEGLFHNDYLRRHGLVSPV
ncbi:D-arabinono-1,4-lactone oxidase, partial [Actinotalea sp. C106]|uniref:D-arabinono-1,4-lactone oxidase n=1 Tax=Actinotalea sp. C106 TaxID=2908644 RepID=UPI0020281681